MDRTRRARRGCASSTTTGEATNGSDASGLETATSDVLRIRVLCPGEEEDCRGAGDATWVSIACASPDKSERGGGGDLGSDAIVGTPPCSDVDGGCGELESESRGGVGD